ncbi:hypothetical protein N7449_004225 [Penicillium cf. viridicatum]|uniref:Uncharacterized protein n=1 Tax=Penicillium cf. viridicatum TaxID=2972119 RepID=A0A9W9MYF3_9EURO|nr:hypothetical protein N7449_004225 [Penicillium cf. viridicatum]
MAIAAVAVSEMGCLISQPSQCWRRSRLWAYDYAIRADLTDASTVPAMNKGAVIDLGYDES